MEKHLGSRETKLLDFSEQKDWQLKNFLASFPRLAVVKGVVRKKVKLKKGNGGWGDRRDHQLCRNITR